MMAFKISLKHSVATSTFPQVRKLKDQSTCCASTQSLLQNVALLLFYLCIISCVCVLKLNRPQQEKTFDF